MPNLLRNCKENKRGFELFMKRNDNTNSLDSVMQAIILFLIRPVMIKTYDQGSLEVDIFALETQNHCFSE